MYLNTVFKYNVFKYCLALLLIIDENWSFAAKLMNINNYDESSGIATLWREYFSWSIPILTLKY